MKTTKKSAAKKPKTTRGTKSTTKPAKGRTAVYDATAARAKAPATTGADAYQSPTIDAPPKDNKEPRRERAQEPSTTRELDELEVEGDAIDGARLSMCLRFAARVTPREDGVIVLTRDDEGRPLVSGHDQHRSHTGFLPVKSAMECQIAVPRDEAIAFADMLDGLSWPRVRIDFLGMAKIRHGGAQPPAQFDLGHAPITQIWQPPTQSGHLQSVGPLRISASWQAAACRWPKAIVHSFQSASGVEWNTLTDEVTGELLARAVLAEDGKDLYPEDERQTEIPGSRTAGGSIKAAVDDLRKLGRDLGATMSVSVSGGATKVVLDAPKVGTPDDTVSITAGGVPVDASPTPAADTSSAAVTSWPDAGTRPVVVEEPEGDVVVRPKDGG